MQVKFQGHGGTGIPGAAVRIHLCPQVLSILLQKDLRLLPGDGIGKAGVLHVHAEPQGVSLGHAFAQIRIPQHEPVTQMIPHKLEHSLTVISAVVHALHVIRCTEGVILVQLIDVGVDVAQVGVVHFRNCMLRQVGVILLCKVQVAGKFAAVIAGQGLLPEPFQIPLPVVEGAQIRVRAHVAIVVQSHPGRPAARLQHIGAQLFLGDACPLGENIRGTHRHRNGIRHHIQHQLQQLCLVGNGAVLATPLLPVAAYKTAFHKAKNVLIIL